MVHYIVYHYNNIINNNDLITQLNGKKIYCGSITLSTNNAWETNTTIDLSREFSTIDIIVASGKHAYYVVTANKVSNTVVRIGIRCVTGAVSDKDVINYIVIGTSANK